VTNETTSATLEDAVTGQLVGCEPCSIELPRIEIIPFLGDALPLGDGLIAMFKAYMDRAAKRGSKDEVMCVACAIFKPVAYGQFVRDWNRILKAWGAKQFHAKEFFPGTGEFERDTPERRQLFEDHSRRIPQIISQSIARIVVISFRPQEFLAMASPQWKKQIGTSLHSQAIQACLLINGDWLKTDKIDDESFAYFMESGDEDEAEVLRAVQGMRAHESTSRHIRVSSFTSVDKGQARELEVADYVAWQWNKYYIESDSWTDRSRWPRKDFLSLIDGAARNKCKLLFLSGDDLKYFFDLFDYMLKG
jgi:hypothetical protein